MKKKKRLIYGEQVILSTDMLSYIIRLVDHYNSRRLDCVFFERRIGLIRTEIEGEKLKFEY